MVVEDGDTVAEPEVAPPVEKFVPVQEVASVDDQISEVEFPFVMVDAEADNDAVGAGPLSVTESVMVFVPFVANDLLAVEFVPKTVPPSLQE